MNAFTRAFRLSLLPVIAHKCAHIAGINSGVIETWWTKSGRLMVGFRCECGRLSDVHPSRKYYPRIRKK